MAAAKKPDLGKWKDFRLEGLEINGKTIKEGKDRKYYLKKLQNVVDDLEELVDVGEDFGIFQAAQYANKTLKKAYKLVKDVR